MPNRGRPHFYLRKVAPPQRATRHVRLLLVVAVSAILLYALLLSDNGLWRLRQQQREVDQLENELQWLGAQQTELRERLADLERPGSFLLEKVARERYGMHREGERVIQVIGGHTEGLAPPPAAPPAHGVEGGSP